MTRSLPRTKTRQGKHRRIAHCERLEDRLVPTFSLGGLGGTFSLGSLGGLLGGGFGIDPTLGGLPGGTTADTGGAQDQGTDFSGPGSTLSSPLSVTGTTPADGATVGDSVSTVTVTFDKAIDPIWLLNDFEVRQIDAPGGNPASIPILSESVEPSHPDQVVLSLVGSLQPGQYQVVLLGLNSVTGVDGSYVNTMLQDQVLATFSVAKPGATEADARYLGVAGPKVKTVQGSLDFAADPSAVALYSFVVPSGSTWRVGAEVQAQRIGSPIDTVLTLFDTNGHILASDDVGRPGATWDPYLFQTLSSGLYYLGVSGVGNTPGQPGGYDLADGFAGSGGQRQPGGAFQLQLVADPVTRPTTVSRFQIDHADPGWAGPTGFSIGFSGAVQVAPSGGNLAESADRDLVLVDQNGQTWPILAVGYDESGARLTYVFQQALPVGHYRVELPEQGGLTDLAGQPPVAPGETGRVLAEFDVTAPPSKAAAGNLGPVFPGTSGQSNLPTLELQPGQTWSSRLVTLADGLTTIQVSAAGGLVEADLLDSSGRVVQSLMTGSSQSSLPLAKGVWTLRIRAFSGPEVQVRVSLVSQSQENLLENGVGQGPALSLRFVTGSGSPGQPGGPPVLGTGSGSSSSPVPSPISTGPTGPLAGPSLPGSGLGPSSGPDSSSTLPLVGSMRLQAEPSTPGGVPLTFGGQPVGRSGPGSEHVPAVGPEYVSGSVAYASNSSVPPAQGLEQPDFEGPLTSTEAQVPLGTGRRPRSESSSAEAEQAGKAKPSTDGALLEEANLSPVGAPPVLVELPGLSRRLRSALADVLATVGMGPQDPAASPEQAQAPSDKGKVDLVMLASPMDLAVGAFLAIQGRRRLARWLGRRSRWQAASRSCRATTPSPHPGRVGQDRRETVQV